MVHRFSKSFSVSKMGPSNRTKAECRNRVQEKTKFGQKNTRKHQPPPQAHFTSPNPPRPSRRSVSDGVIQLIFVFGAMLSLVQSIGLAREGMACENRRTQGLRFKERVRQVIFRYAPLEWFGKSTLGTCIWGGVKTDVVLVDLDPSDKQQMWNG